MQSQAAAKGACVQHPFIQHAAQGNGVLSTPQLTESDHQTREAHSLISQEILDSLKLTVNTSQPLPIFPRMHLCKALDGPTSGHLLLMLSFSLQVEYSRSGSKMWASQRATSNSTEIKNLLLNALYTIRVSVYFLSGHWLALERRELAPACHLYAYV